MKYYLILIIVFFSFNAFAQPANDGIDGAMLISNVFDFCTADAAYSNVNATASGYSKGTFWPSAGKDVWYKFTAQRYDVSITATGKVTQNSSNTLVNPLIALYTYDGASITEMLGTMNTSNNVTTLYKGGLTIGQVYYIRISANNDAVGTFKFCMNNYTPPIKPGQDCSSASQLCSKETITESNISGAGANNREGANTCLGTESNSAWYTWTAATSGTLTFTIKPSVASDDIDWALYDVGVNGTCSGINGGNAIRCASGSGVTCTPFYNQTGLNMSATETSESAGCVPGQDGFVRYVDMIAGHVYYLLIDNFSGGNNGFNLEFGGTGTFLGPQAKINMVRNQPCTVNQSYTFTTTASNYSTLKWTFGEGASIASATGTGPFNITYATTGSKTVVVQATNTKGCAIVDVSNFLVSLKPNPPALSINQQQFCLGNTVTMTADSILDGKYNWTGPNGFSSTNRVVSFIADDYNKAGNYTATVTVNGCISDPSTINVPPIKTTPVIDFTVTENNACTKQQSYTINNKTTDYQTLKWTFGAGASLSNSSSNGPFTITYSSPGTKTITLEADGGSGCIVQKSINIDVSPVPDVPTVSSNKHNYCLTDTIRLTSPLLPNTIYTWTGPDNFTANTNNVAVVVSSKNAAGTYSLTITQGKCTSAASTITIPTIRPNPVAKFRTSPTIPSKLALPVTVIFFNESTDADSFLWDFGDGTTSTAVNPTHEYTAVGDYNVSLTAYLSDVCFSSITKGKFVIRPESNMFIPNTFTPNGDGINDEFVINITNLNAYEISIFNRYGTRLFTSDDIFANWNGTFQNTPVPVGTYFYIIRALDVNNNEIKQSGSVTVLR